MTPKFIFTIELLGTDGPWWLSNKTPAVASCSQRISLIASNKEVCYGARANTGV